MNGQLVASASSGHESVFASPQHHPELEQLAATMPPATIDASVRSQSRMSISHAKGLLNRPGQNNCFMNSAVQVLWHLDIFRRSFRELRGHACMGDSCIFCALKELFNQFQSSKESALPPDSLRFALAEAFSDQRRFQLGYMDDAAECFENILLRIHYHLTNEEVNDAEPQCQPHCISHQKFAMNLSEQIACHSCGATSKPFVFSQMVHYASTTALCSQAKLYKGDNSLSFGSLLRMATSMGDIRNCPKMCGTQNHNIKNIRRVLLNRPDVISVGLVWDSELANLGLIRSIFQLIETSIALHEVFDLDIAGATHKKHQLNLVGLVAYYGKHYSTYLFNTKLAEWIYFDDATVRVIGPSWSMVVEKILKSHGQPLLLLYANPNAPPISAQYSLNGVVPMTAIKKKPSVERANCNGPMVGKLDVPDSPSATSTTSYFSDIGDSTDGYISRKTVESILKIQQHNKKSDSSEQFNKRHNRNSSSSLDSFDSAFRFPRSHIMESNLLCSLQRRDSGNSSGDRSSSVSSVDAPYYPYRRPLKSVQQKSSKQSIDQGYDSFSLSSSDSFPSTSTSPSKMSGQKLKPQLKQIPEVIHSLEMMSANSMTECDQLCSEVDILLLRSQEKEHEGDLRGAAALSDSAAAKARIAMDAPYSNHQTLISAKMKHSLCVMRSTSLHKRVQELEAEERRLMKATHDFHHSRQSSRDSTHGGKHSRQGSRDSKDPRVCAISPPKSTAVPAASPVANLEIYATLPKRSKRKSLLKTSNGNLTNEEVTAEGRAKVTPKNSILQQPSNNNFVPVEKKVQGSECDNFSDYYSEWEGIKKKSVPGKVPLGNSSGWQSCRENDSEVYGVTQTSTLRKQCKVKRKLLLGGLLKSKNRSMPDLREDNLQEKGTTSTGPTMANDDSTARGSSVANIHRGFHLNSSGNRGKPALLKVKPPLIGEIASVTCKTMPTISSQNDSIYANTAFLQATPLSATSGHNQPQLQMEEPTKMSLPSSVAEPETKPSTNSFLLELNKKRLEILTKSNRSSSSSAENRMNKAKVDGAMANAMGGTLDSKLPTRKPSNREIATFISRNAVPPKESSLGQHSPKLNAAVAELTQRLNQIAMSGPKNASAEPRASPVVSSSGAIHVPIPIHASSSSNVHAPTPPPTSNLPTNPNRPMRPPDYETTMKRIEMNHLDQRPFPAPPPPLSPSLYTGPSLECKEATPAAADRTRSMLAMSHSLDRRLKVVIGSWNLPPVPCHRTNSSASQSNRGKKKSVKFSDHIEWVACADDDDPEEHLPNPLLEKVLSNKSVVYTLQ